MKNKEDLRGAFLNSSDDMETFEAPNGLKFKMEPLTVKDVIEMEKNDNLRLDKPEKAKSNMQMTFELIVKHMYDGSGEFKVFNSYEVDKLLNKPFQSEFIQCLIDAFNEVNADAEVNEDGEIEVDKPKKK